MDNDDKTIGRILTRREALTLIGATGLTVLIGCAPEAVTPTETATSVPVDPTATPLPPTATSPAIQPTATAEVVPTEAVSTEVAQLPNCVVQPEVTEGPYYVDVDLIRQDITEGLAGTPLALTFNVVQVGEDGCVPMQNALVEIWHCDINGAYSGVSDPGFDTTGQTWLRGAQMTDANGNATFNTIYPGWYSSRCIHIHFKVFPTEELVFTSQLFFPDEFNNQVVTQAPYDKGTPDTTNGTDSIYQDSLLASPAMSGEGVAATFALGIDLSTVGTGGSGGGPGGRPPGDG